jgi:hypothetical protein
MITPNVIILLNMTNILVANDRVFWAYPELSR